MKLLRLTISKLQGKICEKCLKMVTRVGIYGPHTQVKCLLKALIFSTYKNNILISSQIRFELYQSHSLTDLYSLLYIQDNERVDMKIIFKFFDFPR